MVTIVSLVMDIVSKLIYGNVQNKEVDSYNMEANRIIFQARKNQGNEEIIWHYE